MKNNFNQKVQDFFHFWESNIYNFYHKSCAWFVIFPIAFTFYCNDAICSISCVELVGCQIEGGLYVLSYLRSYRSMVDAVEQILHSPSLKANKYNSNSDYKILIRNIIYDQFDRCLMKIQVIISKHKREKRNRERSHREKKGSNAKLLKTIPSWHCCI